MNVSLSSNDSGTCAVTVQNLSVRLGEQDVLRDVDVRVQSGEVLCVLGPNGAGKSTFLKAIAGIVQASSGEIFLQESPLSDLSQQEIAARIGYVPQFARIGMPLPVREFMILSRYSRLGSFGRIDDCDREIVSRLASEVGVRELLDREMNTLSGGEQRLVLLAAALAQEPQILLLDEPTSALDPAQQQQFMKILTRVLGEQSVTAIMVTHDLNLAVLVSSMVLGLRSGSVLFHEDVAGIARGKQLEDLFGIPLRQVPVAEREHPLLIAECYESTGRAE